jgi:hypothetical protein
MYDNIISKKGRHMFVIPVIRPPFEFNYQEKMSENRTFLYNVYNNSLWEQHVWPALLY